MEYNPLSPEVQDNPYPYYVELRNKAPVAWIEPMQAWAVSRYAAVYPSAHVPRIAAFLVRGPQTLPLQFAL